MNKEIQFKFVLVYGFGFWATRKNWKKEKQDIWLQVRNMREELEREEVNGNTQIL
jgi:hypothetical protein